MRGGAPAVLSWFPMPKTSDILGHEAIRRELEGDLASGNVSHAYLFAGPRHLGKMTLARRFAVQLLSVGEDPSTVERIRHDCDRLMHPDLFVLDQLWIAEQREDWAVIAQTSNAPQQQRAEKPFAKTDTIGIGDIHALQRLLQETSGGRYRCCIIRSVERLTTDAVGAILKILEEPPAPLVFVFTTQALSSLPPTIVSRMRVLRFHPLGHRELSPFLEGAPEEDRQFLLHLSQGAPGIVHRLKNDPELLRTHRLVHTKAVSFWKTHSLRERLQILEPLAERGEEAEQLLLHLALALREHGSAPATSVAALCVLSDGLRTNAHRGLLARRFAASLS